MSVDITPASLLHTSTWAGGTTTELRIFPTESVYQERNFDVRISSARVDLDQSEFTSLPEYTRYIMPLKGELELEHEGNVGARLSPYQVHCFEGAWRTTSKGKCTDFNLMLRHGWEGEMGTLAIGEAREYRVLSLLCVYVLEPSILVVDGEAFDGQSVKPGDVISICAYEGTRSIALLPEQEEHVSAPLAVWASAWRSEV